jgi:uncharacterized protein YdhG (YjbR/CyaY superfamily)
MAQQKYASVDEYIAGFSSNVQNVLERVRETIREAAPEAEERISYHMPAYRQAGNLVYFSAFKNHVSLFGAGSAVEAFKDELAPYVGDKGALRFAYDRPIPYALIADVVRFRVKENLTKPR